MEEKINIAELLKCCQSGMELDCTMFENVTFERVADNGIWVKHVDSKSRKHDLYLYYDGSFPIHNLGSLQTKCVIFPKGKTTWEGFVPPCKFKVGDWIVFNGFILYVKEIVNGFYRTISKGDGIPNSYDWNIDNVARLWTIQDAKDGDVISYDDGWTCIFKCIHGIWYSSYCFITNDGEFHTSYERHAIDTKINGNAHLATKEQRDFLFQKIKEASYEWVADKKELNKKGKMKQEDKELLLRDLCARLPYGVRFPMKIWDDKEEKIVEKIAELDIYNKSGYAVGTIVNGPVKEYVGEIVKPYLFPMSSMTMEQKIECFGGIDIELDEYGDIWSKFPINNNDIILTNIQDWLNVIDWLNENHFDYRGLIEKGLAIDATNLNIY